MVLDEYILLSKPAIDVCSHFIINHEKMMRDMNIGNHLRNQVLRRGDEKLEGIVYDSLYVHQKINNYFQNWLQDCLLDLTLSSIDLEQII